jgi:hypothetical protein
MTELERALVQLGDELAFPEAPDVSGRVLARLAAAQPARRRRRRLLVLAVAVVAVALAAAMAVPQARTAILEFFHLRGATVQRVETLPNVPEIDPAIARALELGRPVPLEDGHPLVKMNTVLVPSALGAPDSAYISRAIPGKVTLVYEPGPDVPRSDYTGVGILVSEFAGNLDNDEYISKLAAGDTRVEELEVAGFPAVWLEGGPHFLFYRRPDGALQEDSGRLAGNTLLVERGDVLVRIEGELSRERAIEIAESLEAG